ncbi:MAG: hypothetical protein V2I54_00730 [Bacteroidales bacterium]|jgi:hypothetical protein|nr:hypothetical protein [Bacteroidales bacterium]
MKNLSWVILILLFTSSCRKAKEVKEWFQDPPVSPVTQTIKTVIPVGYAAEVAILTLKGYNLPNTKISESKNSTLIYIDTSVDYPYRFKDDSYGQMVVAALETGENTALISVFFTDMDITTGSFKLLNVIAFPVVFTQEKITAVYVAMDINLGSNLNIGIDLTQEEIDQHLAKLNHERTEIYEVAISQNAWIIDIYHQGTYENLLDDEFKIFGGQQAVAVENYETESSVGALQMAMIDTDFSSGCIKNPTHGHVFLQDVEVSSSTNTNDIVFGHVLYEFHPNCDGEILVNAATGNFVFAIGDELDLGLN